MHQITSESNLLCLIIENASNDPYESNPVICDAAILVNIESLDKPCSHFFLKKMGLDQILKLGLIEIIHERHDLSCNMLDSRYLPEKFSLPEGTYVFLNFIECDSKGEDLPLEEFDSYVEWIGTRLSETLDSSHILIPRDNTTPLEKRIRPFYEREIFQNNTEHGLRKGVKRI